MQVLRSTSIPADATRWRDQLAAATATARSETTYGGRCGRRRLSARNPQDSSGQAPLRSSREAGRASRGTPRGGAIAPSQPFPLRGVGSAVSECFPRDSFGVPWLPCEAAGGMFLPLVPLRGSRRVTRASARVCFPLVPLRGSRRVTRASAPVCFPLGPPRGSRRATRVSSRVRLEGATRPPPPPPPPHPAAPRPGAPPPRVRGRPGRAVHPSTKLRAPGFWQGQICRSQLHFGH